VVGREEREPKNGPCFGGGISGVFSTACIRSLIRHTTGGDQCYDGSGWAWQCPNINKSGLAQERFHLAWDYHTPTPKHRSQSDHRRGHRIGTGISHRKQEPSIGTQRAVYVFACCWNDPLRHEGAGNPSKIKGVGVAKIFYRLFPQLDAVRKLSAPDVFAREGQRGPTGQSMKELYDQNIFGPMGMKDTQFPVNQEIQSPVLHAFTMDRKFYEDCTYWNPFWARRRGCPPPTFTT
jgi:hypothetical protein